MDPGEASDGELLAATRSRLEAFAAFYDRYETAVIGYFTRRTGDPEVAAARNTLAESLRRGRVEAHARRRVGICETVAFTSDELERVEYAASTNGWVMELLQRLPTQQREAVRARILEERSYPDIADGLQTSELVIRKRVSRGLSNLRAELEKPS